jgi:hypothetical protein
MSDVAKTADPDLMELAKQIYLRHTEIVSAKRNIVVQAIEVGELLNQAKARLKHGEWLPWLKDNCMLKERTAERYMHLATNKQKLAEVLAAKSVPMSDLESLNEAVRLISEEEPTETAPATATESAETKKAETKKDATGLLGKIGEAEESYVSLMTEYAKIDLCFANKMAALHVKTLIRHGLYIKK